MSVLVVFRSLLLFALIVRALVPAGFMPAAAANGHGLTLVICNGSGELQTITLDDQGRQAPSNSERTAHEPCAFSAHVALAGPSFDVASLPNVVVTDGALVVAIRTTRADVRVGPPLGSRAPPYIS